MRFQDRVFSWLRSAVVSMRRRWWLWFALFVLKLGEGRLFAWLNQKIDEQSGRVMTDLLEVLRWSSDNTLGVVGIVFAASLLIIFIHAYFWAPQETSPSESTNELREELGMLRRMVPQGGYTAQRNLIDETSAHIIPLGGNKFSVMFPEPMRCTPTITFEEPQNPEHVQLEYWGPMGFTVTLATDAEIQRLRFTADARSKEEADQPVQQPTQLSPPLLRLLLSAWADGGQPPLTVGRVTTIMFRRKVVDHGNNFHVDTLTVEQSGAYRFEALIDFSTWDRNADEFEFTVVTSNRTFPRSFRPEQLAHRLPLSMSIDAEMDAGDTAIFQIRQSGGSPMTFIKDGSYWRVYMVS